MSIRSNVVARPGSGVYIVEALGLGLPWRAQTPMSGADGTAAPRGHMAASRGVPRLGFLSAGWSGITRGRSRPTAEPGMGVNSTRWSADDAAQSEKAEEGKAGARRSGGES